MKNYMEIVGTEALAAKAAPEEIEAAINRLAGLSGSQEIVVCLRALKQRNTYGALINVRAAIAAANDAQ